MGPGIHIALGLGQTDRTAAVDAPSPPGALTLRDFAADQLIFDTGGAFGRNAARIPLSGTATPGADIQVRLVHADGTGAHTGWVMIASAGADGAWTGFLNDGPRSPHWMRVEARLAANPGLQVAMGRVCGLGHVIALMGQSEIDRVMVTGGGAYTGTLARTDQVQIVVGTPTFTPVDQPGNDVASYDITRGFLGVAGTDAPKMTHAADLIQKNTPDLVMLIDLALSASARWQLSDDGTARRRWSDFLAVLEAAGWSDGVRPGVIVDMWTASDVAFSLDFFKAYKPFYTGRTAAGADYVPGTDYTVETFPGTPGSDDQTIRHDHILFDLTGRGLGLFDPAATRIALCHHRYTPSTAAGPLRNAVTTADGELATDMLGQEAIRRTLFADMLGDPDLSQIMVRGTEPLNYSNGADFTGTWDDNAHPSPGTDGLELFARHLAHAGLRAAGVVPGTIPAFDVVSFDPAGAFADFAWSGGDVTTTRKLRGAADLDTTYDHWTDVFGFEFNGTPVARAEIVDADGNPASAGRVRVYVPTAQAPADWSRDRFFFARGGGSGILVPGAEGFSGVWQNYPVIDAAAAGVAGLYDDQFQAAGGIALRPGGPRGLGAAPAYAAAALPLRGTWFENPEGMQAAAGGVSATQLRAEMRLSIAATQAQAMLLAVGTRMTLGVGRTGKLRLDFWGGGGLALESTVSITPEVRHDIVAVLDITTGAHSVTVDGVTVLAHDTSGSSLSRFVNSDTLRVLNSGAGEVVGFDLERVDIWINDNAKAAAPYKSIAAGSGAGALNTDPWKRGSDAVG